MHIIYTSLTGRQGIPSFDKNKDWLKFRIEFFKKYTINSLINQSEHNFLHWISFREKTEEEPLINELREYLKSLNYNFVFTFGFQYPHPKYQTKEFRKEIPERLQRSLDIVKKLYQGQKSIYLTFLDSDDLFHRDAIKEIQSYDFKYKRALCFDKGYIYNTNTKVLAQWNPDTCPPFSTILYPVETFFNAKKHLEYRPGYVSHLTVPRLFNVIKLSGRKYIVGCHGMNSTTTWRHSFRGPMYQNEEEKQNILKDFGIN